MCFCTCLCLLVHALITVATHFIIVNDCVFIIVNDELNLLGLLLQAIHDFSMVVLSCSHQA